MRNVYKTFLVSLVTILASTVVFASTTTSTNQSVTTSVQAEKSSQKEIKTDWTEDFKTAQAEAKKDNKFILMDFTGSDWCPWCIKLEKEVFSTSSFKEFAAKNLVLFKADFPKARELSKSTKEQNQKLAKQYEVEGFPTVFIIAPDGKTVVLKTGYQRGGPDLYIKSIQKAIDKYTTDQQPKKETKA